MPDADDEKKRIGLLSSNFVETMKRGYFVDKSLLIKEMIDMGAEVTLITRPRRFGKSLNLSMIQTFLRRQRRITPSTSRVSKSGSAGKSTEPNKGSILSYT